MSPVRLRLLLGLFVAGAFPLAGPVRSQEPQAQREKFAVEVVSLTQEPRNAKPGDEITVTATIRNRRPRLVVVNVRLLPPAQVVVVVPEAEQILFVEAKAQRNVKWRAKVVGEGPWQLRADSDAVAEGRPVNGPRPEVPAEAKAALAKVWAGTWTSPDGFVYDAQVQVRLDASGAVDGRIDWTPKKAPVDRTDYTGKVGQAGVEYVWGIYDPRSRDLHMDGYRRDDPKQILGLDKYRLTLSEDYAEIRGATWNHGTWKAAFRLAPK